MARNGDETGVGGESAGWLGHVCARLKAKADEALDAICDAPKVEDVAEAEKLARAVGVIARAAKAVAALGPRLAADSEENELGGRIYDPRKQSESDESSKPIGTGSTASWRKGEPRRLSERELRRHGRRAKILKHQIESQDDD